MSTHRIKVPDLGEGIAEVELVAWHVAPGETIAEDQPLADVMTDKATVEIPSPVAGKVRALGGEVGKMLAVGADLIEIELEGGAPAGPAHTAASAAVAPAAAAPAPAAAAPTPSRAEAPAPRAAAPAKAPAPSAHRPIASPAVRARAWELGIDLADVAASGSTGRIVQADLDAHVARGGARTKPAATAASPAPRPTLAPGATRDIKIVGLRRVIALKMQESKRRIPHYTYVEEVEIGELENLRKRLPLPAARPTYYWSEPPPAS